MGEELAPYAPADKVTRWLHTGECSRVWHDRFWEWKAEKMQGVSKEIHAEEHDTNGVQPPLRTGTGEAGE